MKYTLSVNTEERVISHGSSLYVKCSPTTMQCFDRFIIARHKFSTRLNKIPIITENHHHCIRRAKAKTVCEGSTRVLRSRLGGDADVFRLRSETTVGGGSPGFKCRSTLIFYRQPNHTAAEQAVDPANQAVAVDKHRRRGRGRR